jgi:hypothetical protein
MSTCGEAAVRTGSRWTTVPFQAPAHLPLLALRVSGQAEQRQSVEKLPELSRKEFSQ